jgi:single-strand DNA-binding protein
VRSGSSQREHSAAVPTGAHVAIEGELRNHEYEHEVVLGTKKTTVTQRVWEIRVDTILKLDRAARIDESANVAASQSQ